MGLAFAVPAIAWYRRTKEKQQADRRIRFLAHHDALTGLTNRPSLIEQLGKDLAVLPARGAISPCTSSTSIASKRLTIRLVTMGAISCSRPLPSAFSRRSGSTTSWPGSAETNLSWCRMGSRERMRLNHSRGVLPLPLPSPVKFKEHEILSTVSIGVSLAPENGDNPERLLKSADLALYKSKADGRNCVRFFQPEMDAELQARINLEKLIRDAVLHDRFELHYQPLFEMSDRRLIGFEALIRLPDGGWNTDPAIGFHSRGRRYAGHRQDRHMGVAGGMPHRRYLAGAPDRCGESVAGAIRCAEASATSLPPRSRSRASRHIGLSWRSPKHYCSATAKRPWLSFRSSRLWASRS